MPDHHDHAAFECMELDPPLVASLGAMARYTDSAKVRIFDTPGMLTLELVEGIYVIAPNGDTAKVCDEELMPIGNPGRDGVRA